jgi:CBS domain-containing protein
MPASRSEHTSDRAEGRGPALSMFSPLSAIVRRGPPTVPLDASVRQALEAMERMRIGSVVVVDREGRIPLGMFTLRDLVRRVSLPGGDLEAPIAGVMTSGLVTLPPQATAHQAALTMARNAVQELVVVDGDGWLVGVVTQNELFGLQRIGVEEVSGEIQTAAEVEGLRRAARGIRRLTEDLLGQGISIETLTHYISTLNDLLTVRIIDLTAEEHDLPPVPMCWIALGSEGRLEQTFSTDQDNGIIFDAGEADAERIRAALLPFARSVNEKLAACGFPLCKGNVMASNPEWCQPLDAWRRTFSRWIHGPDPQAVLNSAIFFDLRPVYGQAALAERLRESVLAAAADRPVFLRHMAEDALRCRPPLGWIRDFAYDRSKEFPHTIELKKNGSRLFVDAARILALAHGVPHTSTAERLRAIERYVRFGEEALQAIVDGFYFVHLVRLRSQCHPRGPGAAANRVDPAELNDLDRHILKESFRQAKRLQTRLALEYQLPT